MNAVAEAYEAGARDALRQIDWPARAPRLAEPKRFHIGMIARIPGFAREFERIVPASALCAVSHMADRDRGWVVACPCGTPGVTTAYAQLTDCPGCERWYLQDEVNVRVAYWPVDGDDV